MLLDNLPEVGEGLISAGTESVGALVGSLGGPGGTIAGLVGGAAAGGALASTARSNLVKYLGADPTVDPIKDATIAAGLNVGLLGLGGALRPLLRSGSKLVEETAREAPMARVSEAARVLGEAQDILTRNQLKDIPKAEAGKQVFDAISASGHQLEQDLGTMKQLVRDRIDVNGDHWDTHNFIQEAGDVLSRRRGVTLAPDEDGILRATLQVDKLPQAEKAQLKGLAELFNDAQARAGQMTFADMDSAVKQLEADAIFDPAAKGTPIQKDFTRLRGALRQDQDLVAKQALGGDTAEWNLYQDAYKNYAGKIDEIRAFRSDFLKRANESGEKFLDGLVKPKESERLRDLKAVLGEDSPEFGLVQDHFAAKLLEQARDPRFGFVNDLQLKRAIKGYGEDVLGEMLGPAEVKRLQVAAEKAGKIPLGDLTSARLGQSREMAASVGALIAGSNLYATTKARILFSLLGKTQEASQYLTTEGLNQLAQKATTPVERTKIVRMMQAFRELTKVAQKKTVTIGGKPVTVMVVPRPLERVVQAGAETSTRQEGGLAPDTTDETGPLGLPAGAGQ